MGKVEKMISCKEPACGQRVSPDIHHNTPPLPGMAPSPNSAEGGDLTMRQPPVAHTDRSNIPFAIDETPTPSRYIRHHYPCEDLFEEVCGGLNPFDEQFRRASQARTQPLVLESSTPHIIEVSSRYDPDHQNGINSSSNQPDRTRNSSGNHHHHPESSNNNGHPIIAVSSYNSDDESLDTPRIVAPPIPADSDHTISSTSRDEYHFPLHHHHHHRSNYHDAPPAAAHNHHHHHSNNNNSNNYNERLAARDSNSNADGEEDCVECGGSYASASRRHGRDGDAGEGSISNQYRVTTSYLSVPKALPFRSLSELSARMFGSHVTINEDGEEVEGDQASNTDRKRRLERQETIVNAEVQIDDEDDQPEHDVMECEGLLHEEVSDTMRRKRRRTSSSRTIFLAGNPSSVRSEDSGFAATLSPVNFEKVLTNGSVGSALSASECTNHNGSADRLHDDNAKRSNKFRNYSSGDVVTSGDRRNTTNTDHHYQPTNVDMISSDSIVHPVRELGVIEENNCNAVIDVMSTSSRLPSQHDETETSDAHPFKTSSSVDRDTPSVMAVDGGRFGGGLVRRTSGVGGGRSALSRHRLSINVTSAAEAVRTSTSTIISTPTPVITAGPSLTQCLKESTSSIEESSSRSHHRLHHNHHNGTRSPTTPPPSHTTVTAAAHGRSRQANGGHQYQDSNYRSRNDTSSTSSNKTSTNTVTGPLSLNALSPSNKAQHESFHSANSMSSSSSSFWAEVGYHRRRTESSSSSVTTMDDCRTGATATVIAAATAMPPASPTATVLQLMLRLPNGQSIPVEIPATPMLSSPSSSIPSTPTTPAGVPGDTASPRYHQQQQQQQPSLAKMRLKAALTASQHASRPMPRPPPSRAHTAHRIAAMTRLPPHTAPSQNDSAIAIKPNTSGSGTTIMPTTTTTTTFTTDVAVSEASSHAAAKSNRSHGGPMMPNGGGSSVGSASRGKKRSMSGDDQHGDKRLKFLERNRAAAVRCREKKKEWVQRLAYKSSELASVNGRLQTEVAALRAEVAALKTLLLQHRTCPVTLAAMTAQQQQGGEQDSSSLLPTSDSLPNKQPPQQRISPHQGMPEKQQTSALSLRSVEGGQLIMSGNAAANVQQLMMNTLPQNLLDLSVAKDATSRVKQRSRSLSLPSIQPGSTVKLATATQIAMLGGTTVLDGSGKNSNNIGDINSSNSNANGGAVSSLASTEFAARMASVTAVPTMMVASQPTLLSIPTDQTTIIPVTQQQQATFVSVSLPHMAPQQPTVVSVMSHIPLVTSSPHQATTTTLIPVVHHCFPSLLASYQHYQPSSVTVSAPSPTSYHPPVIAPAPSTTSHSIAATTKEHFTLTSLASSIQFVQSSLTSSSRILSASPLREFSATAALAAAAVGVNLALPTNLTSGPVLDAGGNKGPTKTIILEQMAPRLLLPTSAKSNRSDPSQAASFHQNFLAASFAAAQTLQQQHHHLSLHEPLVSIEEVPTTAAIIADIAEIEESSSKMAAAAAAAVAASSVDYKMAELVNEDVLSSKKVANVGGGNSDYVRDEGDGMNVIRDDTSGSRTSPRSVVSNYSGGGRVVSNVVYGNLSSLSATNLSRSPPNNKGIQETKDTPLATTTVTTTPPVNVSDGDYRSQTPLPNKSPDGVAASPMEGDFRQSLTILNVPSTCVPTSQTNFIVNVSSGQVMTTCIPTTSFGNSNTVASIVQNRLPTFIVSNNVVSPNNNNINGHRSSSLDDDNSNNSGHSSHSGPSASGRETYLSPDWGQSHVEVGGQTSAQHPSLQYERNTDQSRDSTQTSQGTLSISQAQGFSPNLFLVSNANDNTHHPVTIINTVQTAPDANAYAKSDSS